jgi:hypothetical protein
VLGHRAAVRYDKDGSRVLCSCGYKSVTPLALDAACLSLVMHLQSVVHRGATVIDGDDGLAGVREPRRPYPPHGSGSMERAV